MNQKELSLPNRSAFETWKIVGPWPRVLSFAIDSLFGLALFWLGSHLTNRAPNLTESLFLWVITMWAWEGFWLTLTGTTPGRRVLGLSVFSPRSEGLPHPVQVCIRILIFWLTVPLLGIGLTPITFRKDRRGWHDLLSETLTVGQEKDLPSAFSQTAGQIIQLYQALAVFSTVGALLISTGAGRFVVLSRNDANTDCSNTDLLIKRTPEVLAAISLSPAWHDCTQRLLSEMGPLSDSQLSRIANLASKYHELWTLPEEGRSNYYESEIETLQNEICSGQRSNDSICRTAREMASHNDSTTTNWLGEYQGLIREISSERNSEARTELIKNALRNTNSPVVNSALKDRLWAEQLAQGERPDARSPGSWNEDWNQRQLCWLEALDLDSGSACRDHDFKEAVAAVHGLLGEGDLDRAADKITRLKLGGEVTEFDALLTAWKAKSEGKREEAKEWLDRVPYTSPLRKLASQFANQ